MVTQKIEIVQLAAKQQDESLKKVMYQNSPQDKFYVITKCPSGSNMYMGKLLYLPIQGKPVIVGEGVYISNLDNDEWRIAECKEVQIGYKL